MSSAGNTNEINHNGEGDQFTIFTVVVIVFPKGFDTIIAGLQWSLLYLIKFPDIQDRIHQEIGTILCINMTINI